MAHRHPAPAERQEKLGDRAKVTGSILKAYLAWARQRWDGSLSRLDGRLDPDLALLLDKPVAENKRVLFRQLVSVAKAIAAAEGGSAAAVYHELGRHSAAVNLAGAHKAFDVEAPHQFFDHMDHLHHTFQNFGKSEYARTGQRSGRVSLVGYHEFSPVYCESAVGYYEEALRMMKAPGPIRVVETACHCAGQPACVFEMSW